MNSEGHRQNILREEYTYIGVGYDGSGHYWTQMFVGR
ncbi:CAP domain-containing protein [Halalkalibacter sp. APA_J-10(15)]|nr:CAP domain-containing protein [Halalkalibacter sp. APA_J-10(15)]